MLSQIFIDRPKLAIVIALVTMLLGAMCISNVPVAEYPEIAPPQIMVTASYPGASAEVIADTVASVIESEINGIEDMIYFSSTSDNSGNYQLSITFKSGTDTDIAQVNVQNAVQRAEPTLPAEVKALGVQTVIATADGSCGTRGFVTDALLEQFDTVCACGPMPMLKALCAKTDKPGQISLEARMGCGFGACMGCTIDTVNGPKRVCREGPVFGREENKW